MNELRFPNLFIIGAPKCGSTALSHYLAGHPDIYMSERAGCKEPNYFASDLQFARPSITSRAEYLALFEQAPHNVRYLGEASVRNLCSKVAVQRILEESPDAKLIVMIRNPIEIARALHNQRVKFTEDAVLDFEKAWRLQDERLSSSRGSISRVVSTHAFQFREFAKIGTQLARLYGTVPKNQIYVIDYEDFSNDTLRVYESLLGFLGLESDGRTQFPVLNPRVHYRFPALQQGLARVRIVRERLGIPGGWGIHKAINAMNVHSGSEVPLRPEFRKELQAYFRDEVELLSSLLERDYSYWLKE